MERGAARLRPPHGHGSARGARRAPPSRPPHGTAAAVAACQRRRCTSAAHVCGLVRAGGGRAGGGRFWSQDEQLQGGQLAQEHCVVDCDLWNLQTKCQQHIGSYASKEDAARAYDCAAVHGPGCNERKFPGELISEPPVSLGDERRERKTLHFIAVDWSKGQEAWRVRVKNPQAKHPQHIVLYTFDEDAARAYDCAAVKLHGPGYNERNFPGELISEPPMSLGDERRERKTSRFHGVCWDTRGAVWRAQLWNSQTKRRQFIGYYTSEEDAARAYDHALLELRGPGCTKRNFPNELISETPAAR
ncbi:hypothetical protein FOA52_008531 [Chlamydomonas sp. UWO 241]|nr:hypothetical protein FOA52_008531 [Chlamydomonas sp. UWO 241]